MKNKLFAVLALLSFGLNYAQEETKSRENEVKVNFLNTIAIASVEIGYERFFGRLSKTRSAIGCANATISNMPMCFARLR